MRTIDVHLENGRVFQDEPIVLLLRYSNADISRSKIGETLTLAHNRHMVTPFLTLQQQVGKSP